MRYRTLIPSVVIAGLLFVWAGCDSFLAPNPKSFSTTANFYQKPEHFEQAVNGVYVRLRNLVGNTDYRNLTDRRGPTLTKHFDINLPNTVSGHPQTDEFTMTASNGNATRLWNRTFDLIKESNVILTRIGDVEFEDSNLKERLAAEAKVMRAFGYWFAVQTWGGVPVITKDPRTPQDAVPENGRASKQEVYQQVVADLQDAIGGLPVTYSDAEAGRVTRGAAKFLLGRTHLLTGDYQEALKQFEDLDGAEYPYHLLSDYREVFNPASKNNAELIWEIQYNPALAGQTHLNLLNEILPFNSGKDLLPDNVPLFVPQGNLMPTPDIIESYEPGDERFEASIAWYVKEGNNAYPEIAWPTRTSTTAAGDSLPYLNKYYWPSQVTSNGETLNNWILFRFSDVLLSAAEAQWKLGNTGEAQNYLNRVRDRAGLAPVDLSNFSGKWTGSALGDAILHERSVELLAEGHNWFDLKRFGSDVAIKVMETHGEKYKKRDSKVTADMYNVKEYKLLYPIPTRDIDLGNLTQNSGW